MDVSAKQEMHGSVTLRDRYGQVYCVLRVVGNRPDVTASEIADWLTDMLNARAEHQTQAPDPKTFDERRAPKQEGR